MSGPQAVVPERREVAEQAFRHEMPLFRRYGLDIRQGSPEGQQITQRAAQGHGNISASVQTELANRLAHSSPEGARRVLGWDEDRFLRQNGVSRDQLSPEQRNHLDGIIGNQNQSYEQRKEELRSYIHGIGPQAPRRQEQQPVAEEAPATQAGTPQQTREQRANGAIETIISGYGLTVNYQEQISDWSREHSGREPSVSERTRIASDLLNDLDNNITTHQIHSYMDTPAGREMQGAAERLSRAADRAVSQSNVDREQFNAVVHSVINRGRDRLDNITQ